MNKIMEYMYFGLPGVACDLTKTRLSAGPAADYAQANEEHDLVRRIGGLLDDPERRGRMGAVGRERLRTRLAWERSVPVLVAAYGQLLAGWNVASNEGTPTLRPAAAVRKLAAQE